LRNDSKITHLSLIREDSASASGLYESWSTVSHVAGQPCELCTQYGIRLAPMIRKSLVFASGTASRHIVRSICIHHPMNRQRQRYLHATGYAEIGRDSIMVQTTYITGTLAWEPTEAN
jgi:hypothetical protein